MSAVAAPVPLRSRPRPRRRRWVRWLAGILVVLLVLAGVSAAAGYVYLRRGLPQTSGELVVAGLTQPVRVYRDQWGVPHIYAENLHDLYLAQGYVVAQDRLWQMDISRRAAFGRLSEVFGEATLDADRFLRTLGMGRDARAAVPAVTAETTAAMAAYAAGVNAFIEQAVRAGELQPEFRILGYTPEPWEPVHTLGIARFMAYDLGGNWSTEVWNFQVAQRVGLEQAVELLARYPAEGPVIMQYAAGLDLEPLMQTAYVPEEGLGSNSWVLAGSRTRSGKPLLANDPHLGLGVPGIWYQAHLSVPGELNVIGAVFPGAPGILIGHNEHVAWGLTNLNPDVQDLYLEVPNPANPRAFSYQGRWEPATVISEPIIVQGRPEPVPHEVLITRHGPIITPIAGSKENRPAAALAMRWTAQDPSSEIDAVMGFNRARNWDDFRAALRHFGAPAQNFIFAAADGTIAYRGHGFVPIRAQGTGEFPAPGWTGDHEWTGYIPAAELPETVNPPEGWIATANARVVDDSYPYFLTHNWAPPYRTARLREVLAAAGGWTVQEMMGLQTDVANLQARTLLPVLLPALEQGLGDATAREQDALAVLQEWNHQDAADAAGPAIWWVWYNQIKRAAFLDELGEDLFNRFPDDILVTDRLLTAAAAGRPVSWLDNVHTPETEGLPEVLATAFRATVAELSAVQGNTPARWQWGRLHQLHLQHRTGSHPVMAWLFNLAPRPAAGSRVTVGAASFNRHGTTYTISSAAPWRQVVDLNDLSNSRDIAIPGQSGHPLSPHYDDQLELWWRGEYHPQLFRESDLSQAQLLLLQPGG